MSLLCELVLLQAVLILSLQEDSLFILYWRQVRIQSTVRGVDKQIPVDVHLPGCPLNPEAVIDAIIPLSNK